MAHVLTNLVTHWAGALGLVINAAGAIGLLVFTGEPFPGSVLGKEQMLSVDPTGTRRRLIRAWWGYRLSIAALLAGFVLQLFDLLTT